MKLFMGEAGKSCVEVCKMSGELNNVYCNTIYTALLSQSQWGGRPMEQGVWEEEEKGRR